MHDPRPAESFLHAAMLSTTAPATSRARVDQLMKWAAVALGFWIPISVAVDNILLFLILGYWLLGGDYRSKLDALRGNPVAVAAIALLAGYLVGTLYTIGNGSDVLEALGKAARLLLIPALMPLMRDPEWRARGVGAFLVSMLVSLLVSYLIWLGVIPVGAWFKGTVLDPVAFKAHITHNIFMAFAAFLFALAALDATTRRWRLIYFVLAAAAIVNVLLMVPGRTGHVVVLVLLTYFLVRHLHLRGLVIAGATVGVLALVVALSPDTMLHKRITLADDEYQQWRAGVPPDLTSSIGQRLAYLRNTADMIRDNPVLGVGTGGFPTAYAALASRTGDLLTKNPHNEFLLTIAQLGIGGLLLLLYLFGTQWRLAARLPERYAQGAARGLVLTIGVSSAFTSTLVDHSEALFYLYMSGVLFAGYGARQREATLAHAESGARALGRRAGPTPAGR